MNNEIDTPDIERLHNELKDLKTKLRMTKSDRDMIRKYTSQVNKDMTALQDKYNEVVQERDYYMSNLRDVKNSYNSEITRLKRDNDKLSIDLHTVQQEHEIVDKEFTDTKNELRGINFEFDVLQVDYHDLKEKCSEYQSQLRDVRRKIRIVQSDITENDRFSTKRMNRLVERAELLETERKTLQDQLHLYETELEKQNMLCFLCRAGVKNVKCNQCLEMFCKACYKNIEKCPFCRKEPMSVKLLPSSNSNSNMDINSVNLQLCPYKDTNNIEEDEEEEEEEEYGIEGEIEDEQIEEEIEEIIIT
jgi:chromosome segregation ATPase